MLSGDWAGAGLRIVLEVVMRSRVGTSSSARARLVSSTDPTLCGVLLLHGSRDGGEHRDWGVDAKSAQPGHALEARDAWHLYVEHHSIALVLRVLKPRQCSIP